MNACHRALVLAVAFLVAGCGSAAPASQGATTAGSARASIAGSQAAQPTTCGKVSTSAKLAVVGPSGPGPAAPTRIYRIDEPTKPVELCALPKAPQAKFVSPTVISFIQIPNFTDATPFTEWDSHLMLHDSKDGSNRTVITGTGNIWDFDWSPDGQSVAWGLQSGDGFQLWIKQPGATPKALTGIMPVPPRGYSAGSGNGVWIRFSPSGTYLVMANTVVTGQHMQVFRMSDGHLLWSAAKGGSPLWSRSGDRLYFEDFAGEHIWQSPNTVTIAASDGWLDPTLSPDGCCVAYTLDYGSNPHVEVRDLRSGSRTPVVDLHAAYPVFTSPNVIWLLEMANTGSGMGSPPFTTSGVAIAYDLRTKQPVRLPVFADAGAIASVDIWPH
jgi:hypothetical protein